MAGLDPAEPFDPVERAAAAAAVGVTGRQEAGTVADLARAVEGDPDPRVRVAALGALARLGGRRPDEDDLAGAAWRAAAADPHAGVRRRAAECAADLAEDAGDVVALLDDDDHLVVEAAAFALGELGDDAVDAGAVGALAEVASAHPDGLAREAAVAALGSLGDPAGLPAVLGATGDRPAVRRRAVLALAAFEGPEVEGAIAAALEDRDWQVRQAAEDLTRP